MALVTSVPFLFQFNSSTGQGHRTTMESGVRTPQHVLLTSPNYCEHILHWPSISILDKAHACSSFSIFVFFHVFIKKSIISRLPFQINIGYIHQSDWFKVRNSKKLLGKGAHRSPPKTPSPLFLGRCSRFGLQIQTPYFWLVVVPLPCLGTRFANVNVQHPLNERSKIKYLSSEFCKINHQRVNDKNKYLFSKLF